jgi:hypothetical protein
MKLILLLIPLLLGNNNSDFSSKSYSSSATDLKSNKMIYKEFHEEKFIGGKIDQSITQYKDLSGNLISQRVMEFTDDLSKPNFKLEDYKSGYIEGAELLSKNKVRVFTRKDFNSKLEEEFLTIDEPFVIDGGLTYFFRNNWNDLMSGKTKQFYFIAPAKLDYFKFRVTINSIVTVGGRKGMQLKLEPNSFIIRAFVDPILITYALDTKEILAYKGISNINDKNGKSYSVEIDYTENYGR